jgi:hypothetical protein
MGWSAIEEEEEDLSLGLVNQAPRHEDVEWRYSSTILNLG